MVENISLLFDFTSDISGFAKTLHPIGASCRLPQLADMLIPMGEEAQCGD